MVVQVSALVTGGTVPVCRTEKLAQLQLAINRGTKCCGEYGSTLEAVSGKCFVAGGSKLMWRLPNRQLRFLRRVPYNFNSLSAELNPIRHLLALVGARHIVHVSRVRVKRERWFIFYCLNNTAVDLVYLILLSTCTCFDCLFEPSSGRKSCSRTD